MKKGLTVSRYIFNMTLALTILFPYRLEINQSLKSAAASNDIQNQNKAAPRGFLTEYSHSAM
jgi:hypothetical protein